MVLLSQQDSRTRKSNGRSRLGCMVCRQRRIKCDETRPHCFKCTKSLFACTYDALDPSKEWQRNIVTFNTSLVLVEPTPGTIIKIDQTGNLDSDFNRDLKRPPNKMSQISSVASWTGSMLPGGGYSIRDRQLFDHFMTTTSHDILGSHETWSQKGVQLAINNDFLMHAILLTGASHLHRLNPHDEIYSFLSAKHLHHSLQSLRTALSARPYKSHSNNPDAFMATAFLLIIQAYSTPNFDPDSPVTDRVLPHSQAVFDIVRLTGDRGRSSIFQPICTPKLLPAAFPDAGPALTLMMMVNACFIDRCVPESNAKVYIAVIKSLTPVIEALTSQPDLGGTPPQSLLLYLTQWLSFLPSAFIALVNGNDSEALVIMTHYYAAVAFVLSRTPSGWWWMRERPVFIIERIVAFLGEEWNMWLRWPVEVLENCQMGILDWNADFNTHKIHAAQIATYGEGILEKVQFHFSKIKLEE